MNKQPKGTDNNTMNSGNDKFSLPRIAKGSLEQKLSKIGNDSIDNLFPALSYYILKNAFKYICVDSDLKYDEYYQYKEVIMDLLHYERNKKGYNSFNDDVILNPIPVIKKYEKCIMIIDINENFSTDNSSNNAPTRRIFNRCVKIYFIGEKSEYYNKRLKKKILDSSNTRSLYINTIAYARTERLSKNISSFDDIVKTEQIKRIINTVKSWDNDKKFYEDNGFKRKMGIFMHGPAGTGKSEIARCIASEISADIYILNTMFDAEAYRELRDVSGCRNVVLLIEDADQLLPSDESISNRDDGNLVNSSSANLLNQLLDGALSLDNLVTIVTTNHPDRLISSFKRPGRFLIDEEIGYFTKEQAAEYLFKFGVSFDKIRDLYKGEEDLNGDGKIYSQAKMHDLVIELRTMEYNREAK